MIDAPLPTIYLAGAIRDAVPDDIAWRARVISSLAGRAVFLNPVGGKHYHESTKVWTASGIKPDAKFLVKHDFWCVDRADIVLFNFSALTDKYPNIGTLIEFGRATSTGALLYSILDSGYRGHENQAMYRLHPFLEQNSAQVFSTVDGAIAFLTWHLPVLSGAKPHYGGTCV